ncbi:carboxypeptidase-like regulatory domain-containing protein [Arcticibacter eurypsychrophilus]|uniref:carboxypeptidase-like regulatory domain-containing protein n=1 Tax=Arcticibacter eurypsychrophilus TaxID=1434752 RepID=UPI001B8CDF6A|nr:carboxypeptidase-like regulatory domain-containing protein [Arcticibacter eurypsychrophilus]
MKGILQQLLRNSRVGLMLMLLLFVSKSGYSQQINVRGVIRDASGTLPGISVKVEGTTSGVTSNGSGSFNISVNPNAVLLFSSIGYAMQKVDLSKQVKSASGDYVLSITLKADDTALDEVIVVGFGTQKKVNLTGAVGTVDSKALQD